MFDMFTYFIQVKSLYEMMMRTTTKILYSDSVQWNEWKIPVNLLSDTSQMTVVSW